MINWDKLATDMVLGEDGIYKEVVKPESWFTFDEAHNSRDKHFNQNNALDSIQDIDDLIKEIINDFNIKESYLA